MKWLNDLLGGLPPLLVYLVVAGLVTAESAVVAGLVLPSATALIALGLLANAEVVSIGPALAFAVGAALTGGTVAFHSGHRNGPRLRTTRLGRWIGDERWNRAERLFGRYGGRAVFLGQWIVGARTLMPRLAGMNGVPYHRFAAWHTPAAMLWAVWMTGASYAAGASYDLIAARAGHASGALAVLVVLIAVLVLAGRWLGRHPGPLGMLDVQSERLRTLGPARFLGRLSRRSRTVVDVVLSFAGLLASAGLLLAVIPRVVRFSGLDAADAAITRWAESQWTSDGYLFALQAATVNSPSTLFNAAVVVALGRWWWLRLRGEGISLLAALGPVLPISVLSIAFEWMSPRVRWTTHPSAPVPGLDGYDAVGTADHWAPLAAGHTAQLAAAMGLLAWLLAGRLPWSWRVTVWTTAAIYVVVCAASWVYLGWSRPSETIGALLIGVAFAVLNAAIWSERRKPPQPTPPATA
jgi:membrane protein DedA with SNARE-associated domain